MNNKNDIYEPLPGKIDEIAAQIVDSAYKVHATMGPGLLESVYEECLGQELNKRGLDVKRQVPVPVVYDELKLNMGFRLDLLVADSVIVEVKSVEKLTTLFNAQLLTYLKLAEKRLGFLINFNVALIKDGIRRRIR